MNTIQENLLADVSTILDRYELTVHDVSLVQDTNELISTLLGSLQNFSYEIQATVDLIIHNLEMLKYSYIREDLVLPSEDLQLFNESATYATGEQGRPKFFISKEVMVSLRRMGQSWSAIGRIFSVSRWTIYRRAREFDIVSINAFSDINDQDLMDLVSRYVNQQSRLVGFSLIYGHLKSIGIRVKQSRLRRIIQHFDPTFSQLRWAAVIHRRTYNVRSPNSLWHIDGHHSIVRHGFVIHGAIDGYSRMITFLKCSTNNRSDTVRDLLVEAIEEFSIPSRIRTDFGGENVLIWELMENLMGQNRGSALRGTSTQNQRIERLWRDVFRCVTST